MLIEKKKGYNNKPLQVKIQKNILYQQEKLIMQLNLF